MFGEVFDDLNGSMIGRGLHVVLEVNGSLWRLSCVEVPGRPAELVGKWWC